jgi:hypothetical protein
VENKAWQIAVRRFKILKPLFELGHAERTFAKVNKIAFALGRGMHRGRSRRATVQTPRGGEIAGPKPGRSTQDDGTASDYRHMRNNFSPNVEAFHRGAVRLAQLRHQHRTHGLNTWMIHG